MQCGRWCWAGPAGGRCGILSERLRFLCVLRQQGRQGHGKRASPLVAGRLIGRSSQCGHFCSVGFCAPVLLTTSPPIPAPSLPTLCSSPMIVSVPNVHNILRGAAARGRDRQPGPKDSLERKEAAAPERPRPWTRTRRGRPAPSRSPRLQFQGETQGAGRACTTHRRKHDEVHSGRSRRQENELLPGIY